VSAIETLECALRAPKGKTALVAYLTGGWPTQEAFVTLLQQVATVADAVEIGVPFSDPMADGPTIQRTSQEALANGVTLEWILSTLESMRPRPAAPLLLMGYLNPFLAYGFERLAKSAKQSGVAGFIVPDLPLDEADGFRAEIEAHGLGLVQLVTPVTTPARRDALCDAARGFVYAVTVTGITGGDVGVPEGLADTLGQIRARAKAPVMAGFGIRRSEQVEALSEHADGVIVGSALLDCIRAGDDPAAYLRTLSSYGGEVTL
jgi:tryptophan synthase alpha chain